MARKKQLKDFESFFKEVQNTGYKEYKDALKPMPGDSEFLIEKNKKIANYLLFVEVAYDAIFKDTSKKAKYYDATVVSVRNEFEKRIRAVKYFSMSEESIARLNDQDKHYARFALDPDYASKLQAAALEAEKLNGDPRGFEKKRKGTGFEHAEIQYNGQSWVGR